MALSQLLELITSLVSAVKRALRLKRVEELTDAKETAIESRDQRGFESSLGGSSGPAPDSKYLGMFTRARKKKE